VLLIVFIGLCALGSFLVTVTSFVLTPYTIPAGSMENTVRCGDRVLVNRMSYRSGDPGRADVVVFHPPLAWASMASLTGRPLR